MRHMSNERLPHKIWQWQTQAHRKRGRCVSDWKAQINDAIQKTKIKYWLHANKQAWRIFAENGHYSCKMPPV